MTTNTNDLAQGLLPPALYEADYNLWIKCQVEALQSKQFDQLDLDNLIEELTSLAARDRRELYSCTRLLLTRCLMWVYLPDKRSSSWIRTIREQGDAIYMILEDSPSLQNLLVGADTDSEQNQFAKCYQRARSWAASETGLPLDSFPETCLWTLESLLFHIEDQSEDQSIENYLISTKPG